MCRWCDLTELVVELSPPVTVAALPGLRPGPDGWTAGSCCLCTFDADQMIVIDGRLDEGELDMDEDYAVMVCDACLAAGAALDDVPRERYMLLYKHVPN
jgi:hypothetical protein